MRRNSKTFVLFAAILYIMMGIPELLFARSLTTLHLADSLEQQLSKAKGEDKYKVLHRFYYLYIAQGNKDSVKKHVDKMVAEADRLDIPQYRADARIYLFGQFHNNMQGDSILLNAPSALGLLENLEQWDAYFEIYERMAMWTKFLKGDETAIPEINKMYEKAKEVNSAVGKGIALKCLSVVYAGTGRNEEARKHCVESLNELKKSDKIILRFEVYLFYSGLLRSEGQAEERLKVLKQLEEDLKKHDEIMEKKGIAPNFNVRFYLNRHLCDVYLLNEDYKTAEYYYQLLVDLPFMKTAMSYETIYQAGIELYAKMGKYDKALALTDSIQTLLSNTDMGVSVVDNLKLKIDIYHRMGNANGLYDTFNRMNAINDSLYNIKTNAQLDEIRTRYEIDKITYDKEKQKIYTFTALAGCALMVVVLLLIIAYNRKLRNKNLVLYKQIRESSRSEKKIGDAAKILSEQEPNRETKLYWQLNELMQKERLFIEPTIDRKKLADLLGTNEKYLADAIRQESGETVAIYINRMRLQYALQLLDTEPDMTLESIALDSGHTSYSSFYRAFIKAYGINPSEYRKFSKGKYIAT